MQLYKYDPPNLEGRSTERKDSVMRIDKNLMLFLPHPEWYKHKKGIGYVPTDRAHKEAVEAMKKYNSYSK